MRERWQIAGNWMEKRISPVVGCMHHLEQQRHLYSRQCSAQRGAVNRAKLGPTVINMFFALFSHSSKSL
jgi:hypothetical protein